MTTWIIFSLIQSFTLASLYFVDKIVVTKFVKNPLQPLVITGFFGLIPALVIYALGLVNYLPLLTGFYCLLLGILTVFLFVFYFKSMQSEEVSRFIPFASLANVLILFLAIVLLKERLNPCQYLGVFSLILGSILISLKFGQKLTWSKGLKYMAVYVVITALSSIFQKYLLSSINYFTVYFYAAIGVFIGTLPIALKNYNGLTESVRAKGKKVLFAILLSETLGVAGVFLGIIAISYGPVSLVSAFSSLKLLLVFIFSLSLSTFLPRIIKEDFGTKVLIQKITAIILMILGAFLIFSV